jgi:hypothetical protein
MRYEPVLEEPYANRSLMEGFYLLRGSGIFFALLIILYKDSVFIFTFILSWM